MSTAGIKPRTKFDNRSQGKYARRYLFYPLKPLSFAETQSISPVYTPNFPKTEIVLLEAFPYMAGGAIEGGEIGDTVEEVMGTDAQVKFIMGNTDTGYMQSGMTYLDHLTDLDPEVVVEIQEFIFPNGIKPATIKELNSHLIAKLAEVDGEYSDLISQTINKMIDSCNTATAYCNGQINEIENEINDSKTGKKLAMKSGLDSNDIYLYNQVGRALPEDKSGVNMAQELGKILAGALGAPQINPQEQANQEMVKLELERLKREMAEKDKLIQELSGYEAESAE
jgi:hypothetical protein